MFISYCWEGHSRHRCGRICTLILNCYLYVNVGKVRVDIIWLQNMELMFTARYNTFTLERIIQMYYMHIKSWERVQFVASYPVYIFLMYFFVLATSG
jgi:hypothetical protein